jgi:hypothetical protein
VRLCRSRWRKEGSVRFVVGDALGDAPVRPGRIAMRLGLGQDGVQIRSPRISIRSRSSRRRVPARRSQIAFARGDRTGVLITRVPLPAKTSSNAAVNLLSRSRIRT